VRPDPVKLETLIVNERALPRWFVPARVEAVPRGGVWTFLAGLTDPTVVGVPATQLDGWLPPARSFDPRDVAVRVFRPGHVELAVAAPEQPRLLATSVPGPDGWRARSGGRSLRTVTVNGAFTGVIVPAGARDVTLDYRPPGFAAGASVSLVAVLLLVPALALAGASRHRGTSSWPVTRRVAPELPVS
jgi:Bacterial membrane protein YfhO